MEKNSRDYKFEIVLDATKSDYDELKDNILNNFSAIYCTHDKDVYEKDFYDDAGNLLHSIGDEKYKHTHFIIKLKFAKTLTAVSKIIGCKDSDVSYIKNFNGALRYLIHYNLDNKYNYDFCEVHHNDENLYQKFRKLIYQEIDEATKVDNIEKFIDEYQGWLEMRVLGAYARKINQWDAFRRNYQYFKDILNEHNTINSPNRYHL